MSTRPTGDGAQESLPPLAAALPDEAALRRAFIAEYPLLTREARTDLGADADALSPKVVEGAFVRAWDARARLATPAQLHEFLVQDVHHASARALSKRFAAHRFSSAGSTHPHEEARAVSHAIAEADIEQSWSHIMHALHGEVHSPAALADAAAISRHEAAHHIADATRETSLKGPLAIGAVGLALALGAGIYIDRLGTDARVAQALSAADVRVHTSLSSQMGVVSLDDGSSVRIAPETKLTIPSSFGERLRAVKLDGGAAFRIAKGEAPFQVHVRNAVIVATGTAFTVRAYPGDSGVSVVVTEGSVDVRRGDSHTPVAAGAALVVGGTSSHPASADERSEADAWRQGQFIVAGKPLRDVLPELRRWYNMDILADKALLDRRVTIRASLDSSRQAIRGIEQSAGLEFGWAGQNMVFREKAK